jgi:hypothetical protein
MPSLERNGGEGVAVGGPSDARSTGRACDLCHQRRKITKREAVIHQLVVKKRKLPLADPHPPSLPAGSSLSRGAGEGLSSCTSRRVRVSRYQVLDPHH